MNHFQFSIANFQLKKAASWLVIAVVAIAAIGLLQAEDDGWQRADAPRVWQFPRDHGAHPEFKTEWWYTTGNVITAEGRPFGYELTFFRHGIQPVPAQKTSRWAVRDLIFGHFALTDALAEKFHFHERVDRAALGLAGASSTGMHAWLRDWKIEALPPEPKSGTERYRLVADEPDMAIDFILTPLKPLTLQGERGLSRKSLTPGNASHYYSYTRLQTEGTLRVGSTTHAVKGISWFDHEFSTSALGNEQSGWDWFSIALDSGDELMLYQIRNNDGTIDIASQGAWISARGDKITLSQNDFKITVLEFWKSPHSDARYPMKWRLAIPRLQLELDVTPVLRDQELTLREMSRISYWEGACRINGLLKGKKVTGTGYTELTGYAQALGKVE